MYGGRIIGILPAGASRDEVGLMMAGVAPERAHAEAEERPSELAAIDQQIAAETREG
jgi:simple sugar transport system ATP-binding protein